MSKASALVQTPTSYQGVVGSNPDHALLILGTDLFKKGSSPLGQLGQVRVGRLGTPENIVAGQ